PRYPPLLTFFDLKSESPEHIEAVTLVDFGVVVTGDRGRHRVCNGTIQSQRMDAELRPRVASMTSDERTRRDAALQDECACEMLPSPMMDARFRERDIVSMSYYAGGSRAAVAVACWAGSA